MSMRHHIETTLDGTSSCRINNNILPFCVYWAECNRATKCTWQCESLTDCICTVHDLNSVESVVKQQKEYIHNIDMFNALIKIYEPAHEILILNIKARPRGYKTFLCSAQLIMICILLINVKMPTTVGILTFISRIHTTS